MPYVPPVEPAVLRLFVIEPLTASVGPATLTLSSIEPYAHQEEAPKSISQVGIPGPVATQITTPGGPQADSNLKTIARGIAWEDQDVTTLARVMLPSRGAMLQADMNGTATLKIFDLSSDTPDTAIVTTSSIAAADILFDTLQLGSYWSADNVGYNFKHTQAVTDGKIEGGKVYRYEYSFDTDNDGMVHIISEVAIQGLYST